MTGPGTITFRWKPSAGDGDSLTFSLDGQWQASVAGDIAWAERSFTVTGAGSHTLCWTYRKDGSDSGYNDCGWVDDVRWTGSTGSSDWTTVEYLYDPSGRRIAKVFDGVVRTQYVYDDDNLICQYNGDDALVRKFIHGPSIDQPISMIDVEDANAVYYYHYDALGSVMALSNSAGACVERLPQFCLSPSVKRDTRPANAIWAIARRIGTYSVDV